MDKALWVGIGGFIGAVLRYAVSGYVQQAARSITFPYGTLAVNVIGCFAAGWLSHLAEVRGVFTGEARALIFIGLLGGFTTFSTFGLESMHLFQEGENGFALMNVGAHVALGLGAVWLGRAGAFLVWR